MAVKATPEKAAPKKKADLKKRKAKKDGLIAAGPLVVNMKINKNVIYAGSGVAGLGILYFLGRAMGKINPFGSQESGSGGGGSGGGGGSAPTPGYSVYHRPGFSSSTTERGRYVSALERKKGKPYLWAANGPNAFDCSGYSQWGYKDIGVNVPRQVTEQSNEAPYSIVFETAQRLNDVKHLLKKGDCIGLDYDFGGRFSHVIIYAGGGKYLHASGKECCPCEGSRCKVVKDPLSKFAGVNVRSIYSWV